jgi:hypothetical protein
MKNLIILLLILSNISCDSEDDINPNQAFSIENQKTKNFTYDSKTMSLKVSNIQDSRCPENVQCVRAGEAIVTFNFTLDGTKLTDQVLCINCESPLVYPNELKLGDNTLKLSDVKPFPNTSMVGTLKSAVFEIR